MRPKSRNDFMIAIICALPLEADAVDDLFDETFDRLGSHYGKQPGDANAYINGRIGKHNVVLCHLPGMGKGSAASVASSLQVSYTGIELALVVGICGGAPSSPSGQEIFLGDVIISDSVIEYDFGRQYPGGFQQKSGVKDTLGRPNREIRTLLNALRAENTRNEFQSRIQHYLDTLDQAGTRWRHPQIHDTLFKASYIHKHYDPTTCDCSDIFGEICSGAIESNCDNLGCDKSHVIRCREDVVGVSTHIGTLASADTVMKSGQHRDAIVRKEEIIGFEMEGAGVWDNIPCIIIKGVCDYADSHKNKAWQAYAAATGASATKAFLEYWRPQNHEADKSVSRRSMIPFRRNLRFVGRQDEIYKLEKAISTVQGPQKLAITGLGGVGKTQIALELAYRIQDRDPECSIFWIPCTSHQAVEQACMAIAQMIGVEDVNPAEVKERIKAYFSQKDRKWLLIFDNADEMDMWMDYSSTGSPLKDLLPNNNQGHIVFTTRNRKLAVKLASSDVIHVGELDKKTGMEFLKNSLIEKNLLDDSHTVLALLEQLTFLPLAVAQAAAYINENSIGVSDYLLLLQEQEVDVLELLSEDFGDDGRYKDIQNPVAMTWLISFQQIQKLDQLACDYLSLMACVAPRNIPESFLPQPASKKKKTDALGLLSGYSFITVQSGNASISIHRLVHLATRNWMKKEELFPRYIQYAADRLSENFPTNDEANRQLWREYLPHALALLAQNEFQQQIGQYIDHVRNVADCLGSDGRYNEAGKVLVQVVDIRKQMLGPEHPDTLTSMDKLALLYMKQERWKEAEELEIQLMENRKLTLGPEHPDTLSSMNHLALTYCSRLQWKEAEGLIMRIVKIWRHSFRPGHPHILPSMNTLVTIYWGLGRWKEAEELGLKVVETYKQVLGPDHPETLTSINNLAATYFVQRRWKEAEELLIQIIEVQKRVLGPENPDTLLSIRNLSAVFDQQKKWKEAEELCIQITEVQKRALGSEHPQTLTTLDMLALIYKRQGRLKEAEKLAAQVLETRKQVLGLERPEVFSSIATILDNILTIS